MGAQLKLQPNPTFKASVPVPVSGGPDALVEFTFRHRTKQQMAAFIESREGKSDTESVLEMATGWNLAEPFSAENVGELLENYMGASLAIYRTYVQEIVKVRLGN